jgi:hypothetical protein
MGSSRHIDGQRRWQLANRLHEMLDLLYLILLIALFGISIAMIRFFDRL